MMFSSELVERILDRVPVARLAQLDLDNGPQALPFVFTRVEHGLWSPIDGKPKKSPQIDRLRWLRRHPDVLVLVDHYTDDWSALWWLKLSGTASVVDASEPGWSLAVAGLAGKYPQYENTPMFAGEPTMVRIEWESWKSWASGGDGAVERALGD